MSLSVRSPSDGGTYFFWFPVSLDPSLQPPGLWAKISAKPTYDGTSLNCQFWLSRFHETLRFCRPQLLLSATCFVRYCVSSFRYVGSMVSQHSECPLASRGTGRKSMPWVKLTRSPESGFEKSFGSSAWSRCLG